MMRFGWQSGVDIRSHWFRQYALFTALAILLALIVWVATLPQGFVLPMALLAIGYMVWSFARPVIAVSTIILFYLHVIERSEGITPIEIGFGAYFFGYLAYWFFEKLIVKKEKVLLTTADKLLLGFLVVCVISVLVVLANNQSPLNWFRELLTLFNLLLYFPARDAMKDFRSAKTILIVVFLMVGLVAVNNLVSYRASSLVAKYMWELVGSRKSFGDHYFFPVVVLLVSMLIHARGFKPKSLFSLLLVFFGLALTLTFSRGFWLGAIFGVIVLFLLTETAGKKQLIASIGMGLLALGAVVLLFAGRMGQHIFEALMIRFSSTGSALEDISVAERLVESRAVLALIFESPLIGYGVGSSFSHYNIIDKFTATSLYIHNGYLFMLFKVGVLGTFFFLGFVGMVLAKGVKLAKTTTGHSVIVAPLRGIIAVILGMLLVSVSSNVFIQKESILFLSLGAAFVMSLNNRVE